MSDNTMEDLSTIKGIDLTGCGAYKIKDINHMKSKINHLQGQFDAMKNANDNLKKNATYNRNRFRFLKRIVNTIIKDTKDHSYLMFLDLRRNESVKEMMFKEDIDWYAVD